MSAWKKVEPQRTPTWNYKENPELVGVYHKFEENVGPNQSMLYHIKQEDGSMIAVWGSTVLDGRFSEIEIGSKVKIVYLGDVKSPGGGKPYHNFEVFVDEEEQSEEPPLPEY